MFFRLQHKICGESPWAAIISVFETSGKAIWRGQRLHWRPSCLLTGCAVTIFHSRLGWPRCGLWSHPLLSFCTSRLLPLHLLGPAHLRTKSLLLMAPGNHHFLGKKDPCSVSHQGVRGVRLHFCSHRISSYFLLLFLVSACIPFICLSYFLIFCLL